MSTMAVSFTSAIAGAPLFALAALPDKPLQKISYALSGTFDATLVLEKTINGGKTWTTILTATAATSGQIAVYEDARYRWRCSVYASGTAVTSIADLATESISEWQNNEGTEVLRITELGIETPAITITGTPSSDTDATTKGAVDTLFNARTFKNNVRVATVTNGTLATAFANGQVVDGVTLATGDRILVKNQTAGAENGIYVVGASGAPTRATDFDSDGDIRNAVIPIIQGNVNANTVYKNTNTSAITIDTTALTFASFSGLEVVETVVSSAEILALNASPKTILPALGANKIALPMFGIIFYDATATAYAGIAAGEDLVLRQTDGSGQAFAFIEATGFLDQTTDQYRFFYTASAGNGVLSYGSPVANTPIVLHMLTGEIITGTGAMRVRMFYRIIDLSTLAAAP